MYVEEHQPRRQRAKIRAMTIKGTDDAEQSKRKGHRNQHQYGINLNYPPFYVTFEEEPIVKTPHYVKEAPPLDLNDLPPVDIPRSPVQRRFNRARPQKRRSAKHVQTLSLDELSKYFDRPIAEAAQLLNVGLTVLKKKCREFNIPRWPHRKIKSLDNLINDLQEEAERQEQKDKAAADAVVKRQKLLETEREVIEKRPALGLKSETKKFRQDIFKRRHVATVRAKKSQERERAKEASNNKVSGSGK